MAKATKAARELAAENNLDLDNLTGTGAGGQITKEDVVKASDRAGVDEQPQERAENAAVTTEANRNRNAVRQANVDGASLRSALKTTTVDMYDSKLKQQAAVNRGGRDLAGAPEEGVIGQASGLIQRVSTAGGSMADTVNLVFNPNSGTNRVIFEGETYDAGDEISLSQFESLKDLKSDGVLIFDGEATLGNVPAEMTPEEQQENSETFRAGAESEGEDAPDQADANNAEESTSSADVNEEE